MVPIVRLFRNLPALFALVCATTGQGADPIYRKVGDSVVLNPGQPFNAISSATWKHNTDLASEWFGTGNVDCYRDFKGRCSLNKKDGSFTISNLKVEDSGSYTPEINDKVLNQLELQVIKPVPKPTVSVKCNYEKTLCNLTCEANINPDVGTVKYEWRTGEEVLSNDKELIITENKESSFICMLKNPVSSSSSDGVDNPLSRGNPGAAAGLAVAIVILIVAPALAVIGRFGWYWFKNRKFPTWKEFWCCGKKKATGNDAESAEGKKLLHDASEKSDLEAKIYKDQETNAMRPTETLQIVNENGEALPGHNKEKDGTSNSGSAEGNEIYELARETQTEGEASFREKDETNNLESAEGTNQNLSSVNPVTSVPTEDNDLPKNGKKTDDQDKDPAEDSSSENQVEQHQDSNPKQTQHPNGGTETNISGSGEEHKQNHPAFDAGSIVPTEDKDLPNNCKKTEDQHQKSAEKSPIENHGDSGTEKQTTKASEKPKEPDCDPSIVSAEVSAEPGTNISESSEKDDLFYPASNTVPSGPTEGEASPSYDKKKDEDKTSPGDNEKADEKPKDPDCDPSIVSAEVITRSSPTDDEAPPRDNKEQDGSEPKINNLEPNGGRSTTTVENTSKKEDKTSPGDNEKADDSDQKPALNSFSKNQGDSRTVEQPFKGSETNISVSSEEDDQFHPVSDPVTSVPTDVKVSSSDEEKDEDKDSPNNCKKTDDQGKESAEKSSGVKLGEQHLNSNSNRIQQPYDGTENTSETPSGPETSEQVSADQDQS